MGVRKKSYTAMQVAIITAIYCMAVSTGIAFLNLLLGIFKLLFSYLLIDTFPLKMLAVSVVSLIIVCFFALTYLFISAVYFKFRLMSVESIGKERELKIMFRSMVAKQPPQLEYEHEEQYQLAPSGASIDNLSDYEVIAQPSNSASVGLLEYFDNIQRALFVGGSGSGKTSLLLWLIGRRSGIPIILDPDAKPNKWGQYEAIGGGGDYKAIDKAIDAIASIFAIRSEIYGACGVEDDSIYPKLTIVFDEFHEIVANVVNVWDRLATVLTRGRKHSMQLFIISNANNATLLGLKNNTALLHNFEAEVTLSKTDDKRTVSVKNPDKTVTVFDHCGAFKQKQSFKPIDKLVITSKPRHKPKDDKERNLIISLSKSVVVYDKTVNDLSSQIDKEKVKDAIELINESGCSITATNIAEQLKIRRTAEVMSAIKNHMIELGY